MVVIAFQAAEQIALGRKEGCAFDLEHIGRKSLESDGRVGAARRWLEIVTDARLQIEIGTDRAAIECLDLGGLDTLSEYAFALGLERQPVDVAAEPRLAVPAIAILAVAARSSEERRGGKEWVSTCRSR